MLPAAGSIQRKKWSEPFIGCKIPVGPDVEKKESKTKSSGERVYISQNQPYLCNNITYDTFQSGGNQRYYFVFKDKDDKAVLINGNVRGFESQEDLQAGIQAVLENGPKESRYDIRTTKNGKLYYYIQNEEGKL